MSRVSVAHSPATPSRASVACQVPATGFATSANQKYGGPPCRSPDLAATFPSGAISENSPSSGFSAAKKTRSGAPFHGVTGEAKIASSAVASQLPGELCACESRTENRKIENALAASNAGAAATNRRVRSNGTPIPRWNCCEKLWLNHGNLLPVWVNCWLTMCGPGTSIRSKERPGLPRLKPPQALTCRIDQGPVLAQLEARFFRPTFAR